jgi:rhodanese-related sulfurtransferase
MKRGKTMTQRSHKAILLLVLSFFLIGSAVPVFARLTSIGVKEAYELIQKHSGDPDFVILDVRTAGEYADGHLEKAQNIDFYADTFKSTLDGLDKNKTYLIYCRSGSRSGSTLGLMKELGFRNVYNMEGGFSKWQRTYPVVK